MLIHPCKFIPALVLVAFAGTQAGLRAQDPVTPVQASPTQAPLPSVPASGEGKPQSTDPSRPADPLTEREKELRKFDPLYKSDDTVDALAPGDRARRVDGRAVEPEEKVTVTGSSGSPDLSREYTGPAVLTRSYAVERPNVPENLKFRPFAGVQGVYDTGLTGVILRPDGTPDNRKTFGTVVNFGIDGRHYWQHDIVQLDYSGNINRYSPSSSYDGSNHSFSFNWTHLLSKRVKVSLVNNTSHYSISYSLANPLLSPDINIANVNLATTPNIQIFDNSTTQSTSSLSLTWQKTARLSFNQSGAYFLISRAGSGLVGSKGIQAGNDVSYRITRKTTTGAYYSFTQYQFTRGAGNTSSNTFGLIYSYAFDKRTEFRARLGLSVLQNLGITSVSVDPAIAAILGQSFASVQYYSVSRQGDISASLTRLLRGDRSLHVAYNRGTTPGNGVYLASQQQVIDGGFNMNFRRKYLTSFNVGRNSLNSLSQNVGQYTSNYFHLGVSRPVSHHVQADIGFDYRHYEITDSPLLRNQFRVTAGFSWSNSDFPARVF